MKKNTIIKKINNIDLSTFEIIDIHQYVKDKNHVYYKDCQDHDHHKPILKRIEGADSDSFGRFNDYNYVRDKNYLYDQANRVSGIVDPQTFQRINNIYVKDKHQVYYLGKYCQFLPSQDFKNVDLKTFEIIRDGYAKDKNHVYYLSEREQNPEIPEYRNIKPIIEGADPKTFKVIRDNIAKDKKHVYIGNEILKDVDLDSFTLEKGDYPRDKNYIYYRTCINTMKNGKETIEWITRKADAKTFVWLDKEYAKDKDNIYYFDLGNQGIVNVDYDTFEVIGPSYIRDKNNVYHFNRKIEGADPKTFEIINDDFQKDKNHVYNFGRILEGIDPKTFEIINNYFRKDKDNIYYGYHDQSELLKLVDMRTFQLMEPRIIEEKHAQRNAIDKKHVFIDGKIVEDADPKTFKIISSNYATDKKYVYIKDDCAWNNFKKVEKSDPKTFRIVGAMPTMRCVYARDKNHIYCNGNVFEKADPKTFDIIDQFYSKDKNHIYRNSDLKVVSNLN